MSALLYNPVTNKDVNVDSNQMSILKKAGWLNCNSKEAEGKRAEHAKKSTPEKSEKEQKDAEKVAADAEKAKAIKAKAAKNANPQTAAGAVKDEPK